MAEITEDRRVSAYEGDDEEKGEPAMALQKVETADEFPPLKKVILIMIAVYLSMFLVALDRTIIGTAIPKITDDFHSIGDVGWYGGAYLLTSSAFQLIYGRIYTFYSPKWVLLCAIGIFEVGSTVCATAPNSIAFIIGRAIAGMGSAGIFSGCIIIMVVSIPLHKRPMYQGIFGAIFGIASVAGPLLGGAFTTSSVQWRFCFYLNLPIGAVVAVILAFILHTPHSKNTDTIKQQLIKLDPFGSLVFLPGIVCLLMALQWGGTTYNWGNVRIIVLFILSGMLLTIFVVIQFRSGDNATVPIRIIKQRSIASGVYVSTLSPGAMLVMIYFLPLWFQAIKGVSAVRSGIDILPLVLSLVVASIVAGTLTSKTGYYVPQLLACSVIMSIGAGLLTTLHVTTNSAHWIGYQVIFGFGLGLGMQQAGMAAQVCLSKKDVMTGVSLMFFAQGLGGSIWLAISQAIFNHSLVSKLQNIKDLDSAMIVKSGATELRNIVPATLLPAVLQAYNEALSDTFKVAVGCAAASIVAGLTMEWRNLKGLKQGGPTGEAAETGKQAQEGEATDGNEEEARSRSTSPAVYRRASDILRRKLRI